MPFPYLELHQTTMKTIISRSTFFTTIHEILRLPLRILITKTMQENDLGDENKDQKLSETVHQQLTEFDLLPKVAFLCTWWAKFLKSTDSWARSNQETLLKWRESESIPNMSTIKKNINQKGNQLIHPRLLLARFQARLHITCQNIQEKHPAQWSTRVNSLGFFVFFFHFGKKWAPSPCFLHLWIIWRCRFFRNRLSFGP